MEQIKPVMPNCHHRVRRNFQNKNASGKPKISAAITAIGKPKRQRDPGPKAGQRQCTAVVYAEAQDEAAEGIGLTPDEKWDARHNAGSGRATQSNWVLALLLAATMLVGCTALIATIARLFDLLYTGSAYG